MTRIILVSEVGQERARNLQLRFYSLIVHGLHCIYFSRGNGSTASYMCASAQTNKKEMLSKHQYNQ